MKARNPIDDNYHVPLDMNESSGEECRKSHGTANGVSATARLHDAQEISYCFDSDVGAPEPTHVEIGGMKAAMASRNLDEKEGASEHRRSECLVRG